MEALLAHIFSLSAPLQLAIVLLVVIFRDDIIKFAKAVFSGNDVEINFNGHPAEGENLPEKHSKDWFDGIQDIAQAQGEQLQQLLLLMRGLAQHYNHETTDLLAQILEESKKTNSKLLELEKYGFPTREETFHQRNARESAV